MRSDRRAVLVGTVFVSLAWLGIGISASPGRGFPPEDKDDKSPQKKNVLIVGASSLIGPLGQPQVLGAMLASKEKPMKVQWKVLGNKDVEKMLGESKAWDYVIMDAWQFKRGGTDAPEFPDAVTAFVKKVRAHSPDCKIILFPWWIPSGPNATNEGVMKVFHHCVDAAKANKIWVATTGPAFTEARLARADLNITVNKGDAHPGVHGAYLNACSLYAILTGESPVGLPATLKFPEGEKDLTITAKDAKYLQELAWKVYQRELKDTKPVK